MSDVTLDNLLEIKQPDTRQPLTELLAKRWSPRAFAGKTISDDVLVGLLEAARWSQSSNNQQPWRFIVGQRGTPTFDKLWDCLMEGNQGWAKRAAVLMLAVVRTTSERNGAPNRHAFHDVGAALTHLTIQAASHDIYVHQMGGFHQDKARETFAIPEPFEPLTALALGYLGNVDKLDEGQREREFASRSRKSLSEIVFSETWEEGHPLTK
ncbi:MAG: nitroreductase family protein [Deinococcota bacterium]